MPSVSNPMQQAAFRGCIECIRMLVETPPYYSVDASCGADGLRPIHIAAREGHIQTLRFLSSAGACLQRSDSAGCTALHHAASAGQLRAVRWLLRHGSKILLDQRGRSPIQVAADNDHMEIVNVLAKHATSIPTSVNNKDVNNNTDTRTGRRSSGQTLDKDTSDFTTGSVDDYSFNNSESTTHNRHNPQPPQNTKPFSHLHLGSTPSKISTSPGDCASSSGNSSLSASTSAPSLSPSSSSAVSCGCSTSDETTLVKSVADVSDAFTVEEYQTSDSYQSGNSLVTSPGPFYLHPPNSKDSVSNPPRIDFGTTAECGKGILKKSNHKRQASTTVQTSNNSPFFLHPPENLVSETQQVVGGKMVNSSHPHLHFADPSHDATPKLKVGLAESSSSSSTSSPPQTPPGTKSGMSSTISECISKFQTESTRKDHGISNNKSCAIDVNLKNQINTASIPPPPPPPPPLPSTMMKRDVHKPLCPLPNLPTETNEQQCSNSSSSSSGKDETENDYEDIEEFAANKNQYEQTRKLLRSVSSPPPTNEISHIVGVCGGQTDENKSNNNNSSNVVPPEKSGASSKPPAVGCGKAGVPFIPPHFPTPPQDALIKPSEYLRSIQNKSKPNGSQNGITLHRSSSRVEETMKALGVHQMHDNHPGIMSPVPEETNAEDEFEEINPERINGCVEITGNEKEAQNESTDENNNNNNNNNANTIIRSGCGGIIKPEELMKVNLRKTPMSRTKSAPPLGRVIPDHEEDEHNHPQQLCGETTTNHAESNGHEPLKRASTMSPTTCIGGGCESAADVSKADVIAELAQSSSVGGVREWKEELRRRQKEQEKAVQKEIEQYYQPVNFVSEVPSTDVTGAPIPDWKRQMMAKKAAERAKKEAEEQRRLEIEAKRQASIPMWRRQLIQRRGCDSKYAQ